MTKTAITPTREKNFAKWYQEVIAASDLAEHSISRGSMIIKPWGYGIWEQIQKILDKKIKALGHENVYFPALIPLSFFEKEAKHVEGFAKECAVVTHHRLQEKEGKLVPAGELEEPLIVRPTSEMIIGEALSRWTQSYRELPVLINQWANVFRWEMRTRLFLRTTEFLWQEGHTVHATKEEAVGHAQTMLFTYQDFAENVLAIPMIVGEKTQAERFPGADITYTLEAMMQDKKALQAGTSHFLGQNFARSSEIQFTDDEGERKYAWTTSWGVTTRLIGAMIMTHGDDDGLIVPPAVAPFQAVFLPIIHKEEDRKELLEFCRQIKEKIEEDHSAVSPRLLIDDSQLRGGEKKWKWVKKGIPLRIEVGKKEKETGVLTISRRAFGSMDKLQLSTEEFIRTFSAILQALHDHMLEKAKAFQEKYIFEVDSREEFEKQATKEGFVSACYVEDEKIEKEIKEKFSMTARVLLPAEKEGKCIFSGNPTKYRCLFAKAY